MTVTAEPIVAPLRPEPKRDRWGRYLLPDPETGEEQPWTRVTTFAQTLSNTFALERWKVRQTARGLAQRPELLASVAAAHPEDNRAVDEACEAALEASGGKERARLGTALHAFTEQLDYGASVQIPEQWRADLDAYTKECDVAGLIRWPEFIERITVVPELGVAGTLDRIVEVDDDVTLGDSSEGFVILDVKTGRDLAYAWGEIAIQLACYAHGVALWDPIGGRWQDMPGMNQEWALVAHVPAGEGRCDLYQVDIEAGWAAARDLCGPVRRWRARKDLAEPWSSVAAPPPTAAADSEGGGPEGPVAARAPEPSPSPSVHAERTDWIRRRLAMVPAKDRDTVRRRWPRYDNGAPLPARPPWTTEQIDAISTMLHGVEEALPPNDPGAPKAEPLSVDMPERPDPWGPPPFDDGEAPHPDDVTFVKSMTAKLDEVAKRRLIAWLADAKRIDRPWPPTKRGVAIAEAAEALLRGVSEPELIDAALFAVLDREPHAWIGAELASLTYEQAAELADLANGYAAQLDPGRFAIAEAAGKLRAVREIAAGTERSDG